MTYNTHQWQRRIKDEYDMSAKEVIRLFARDRYSRKLTAATLGIDRSTLVRFADAHEIKFPDRIMDMNKECRGWGYGWPKGKKRGNTQEPIHRTFE